MRKGFEHLITGVTAKLPGDWAKHEAQFRPGSVSPVAALAEAQLLTTLKRARGRVRQRAGQMNKTEAAFAARLETLKQAGAVLWWMFEPIKLRLADATHFTPDFAYLDADGFLWMIDVKGTTKDKQTGKSKAYTMEDARIKLKIGAELFPFRFATVFRVKGEWRIEEV